MKSFNFKRILSLMLVVMMAVTMLPFHAHAAETNVEYSEDGTLEGLENKPFEETILLKQIKADIARILDKYLGTLQMSEEDVKAVVSGMDFETQEEAWLEIDEVLASMFDLTDAEVYFLEQYEGMETFVCFGDELYWLMYPEGGISLFAASGSHNPVTGVTVGVSGATDNSMSNGAVTVTAKGSGGIFGIGASAKTATITIYNETGATSEISFNWTATSVNKLVIDGTTYSGSSGAFSKVMNAGEKFTITITTAKNSTVNKLVMNNFAATTAKAESNVTFDYDGSLGSITVAGAAVADGGVVAVPVSGAAIVATPASGVTFLGWIDMADHQIISKDASTTLKPVGDMTVMPVFAKTSAWFYVNNSFLYEGLSAATTAASSASNKVVILANNGTVPAGNYTIPAGVTLLIPYNATNTLCTTAPTCVEKGDSEANYVTPTAYRTLTLASGANITVNGAISVSGSQYAGQAKGAGVTTGPLGFIKTQSDSSITVNSGANLYVWGYITGSGTVTVKNGGTVYEDFQVMDWRGGTAVSNMIDNSNRVFPMSQYYIQNVEVPMTLEAGATENGYMSVTITLAGVQGSAVPFIGPNGMFNIVSGSVTKDYDETTDRLIVTADGEVTMKSLSISMKLSILGSATINSSKYTLPITNNLTLRIKEGANITITQDIALLPGAELIVDAGAKGTLGKGNIIYIYDATEWALGNFVYMNVKVNTLKYIPGKPSSVPFHDANADAKVHIAGTIDASQGYVYTTASGAVITAEDGAVVKLNPGTSTKTYQAVQGGSDNKQITYTEIPVKTAKLGNTENRCGGIYEYTNGAWVKTSSNHVYNSGKITTNPGCETEGVKTFSCACGHSYTEPVAATGHKEVAVSAVDPTCENTGLAAGTKCEYCDKVFVAQEVIPALGHVPVTDNAVDPTCDKIGLTEGSHCDRCDKVLVAQQEIPALGHKVDVHADCLNPGICTVCGAEAEAALGHNPVTDKAVDPTCLDTGLTEGSHCDRCGEVFVAQEVIPALGHNAVTDKAVDPTCVDTGLTEGSHCDRCGEVLVAQQVVPALGHTAGAPADCNNACTCTVCGAELEAALGHNPVTDKAVAPSCEGTGLTEGSHCDRCGEVLVAQQVVPALGHTLGEHANCTEAGVCIVCGAELEAALGHNPVTDSAVAPTCVDTGLTEGSHCDRCGEILVAQKVVPAAGHKLDEHASCTDEGVCIVCGIVLEAALGHNPVTDSAVAPTCEATGLTEGSHCDRCGEILVAQEDIPALGHIAIVDQAVAPTCEATGLTEGSHCERCNKVLVSQKIVPALGHNPVTDSAVAPTCVNTGLTEGSHCERCGKVLVAREEVPALGHNPATDKAVAPTCVDTGNTEGSHCDRCGITLVAQEVVPALGHNAVTDKAVAPTCLDTGLTEGSHCDRCGITLIAQEVVPALGHTLGTPADCLNAGTCAVCGAELEAPLGHNPATDKAVAPSCESTGLTEGSHCDRCGITLVAQEVVPAIGHNVVTDKAVAPTCDEIGLTEGSHCDRCGKVFVAQDVVPALGHVEVVDEAVEPTCVDTGLTEGIHCDRCGETLVAQHVVSAYGHEWLHINAKAPTRTENGYEAYSACQVCGISTDKVVIPALGEAKITNYNDFIRNLIFLEEIAYMYVQQYPAKDPAALVIKYIRTGVDRYNSGSWGIMAGHEDADFARFVTQIENEANAVVTDGNYVDVTGLKNISNFELPNGKMADIGHVFGAMDITYHNNFGLNHADVSGWAGDLVDLLEVASKEAAAGRVTGDLEEMIALIGKNCFRLTIDLPDYPSFSQEDYDGDLDAFYIMNVLKSVNYGTAYIDGNMGEFDPDDEIYSIAEIIMNYMTEDLTDEYRASYFMTNRLKTNGTRSQVRNAVYAEYLANGLLATLEGTRDLSGAKDLVTLRRAVCYAFADHLCKLAGDYVEKIDNPYYTVFDSSSINLAPGITQEINYATSADGKQMVYYTATGDITRGDVHVYANYAHNDPSLGWEMTRVQDQANAAQEKRSDPTNPNYIPNYNVIASINADGFNMQTGEPSGLLIMDGKQFHGVSKSGFFGITKDGKAVMGTTDDYNKIYKDQLKEAVGGFGTMLIKDGEIAVSKTDDYYTSRASRTAIGVTRTGKVVFMVLDGRQEPFSCGGSMQEIAQIMFESGCVNAINLDGGGSTTFVARQPGEDELSVVNRPSDGYARSVSTSLLMVSTAPSSTEFDHAVIDSEYKYATIGTPVQMTGKGVSPAGNETNLPEGYTWAVSDEKWATISEDGVFTGLRNGSVDVYMMLNGEVIGMTQMNVVVPDSVFFTRTHMDAVYGAKVELPFAANYQGKPVAVKASDIKFTVDNANYGTLEGNVFVGNEASGVKIVTVTACLPDDASVSGSIKLNMYKQGENTFDFSMATGGDRQFAWLREVTNSTTKDSITYEAINRDESMSTSYIFAIDMTQIPIPAQLGDLVYMLPGADATDASAWNFLLQLAERVSVLTEITAVMDFDDNVDVDVSGLNIMNEYFALTSKDFNEATNTLTLKLNWVDQTAAIDPATANPLCMLKGIKITTKDGAIEAAGNRLNVVNAGSLSYKGYLRANALYSFASKPENQEIFGLHPFINPDPKYNGESGAWFGSTYATFEDSYNLAHVIKDGWTMEEGGYAYYVEGEKLYGLNKVNGFYYDFGETGINRGQTKFSGRFFDEEAGVYRYSDLGVLSYGWKEIDGVWNYFDKTTLAAVNGSHVTEDNIRFNFKDGAVLSGTWTRTSDGRRYWYGPSFYSDTSPEPTSARPFVIDGKTYLFNKKGYMKTGIVRYFTGSYINSQAEFVYYDCGTDGVASLLTGFYNEYFYQDGVMQKAYQLVEFEGNYYFINDYNKPFKNGSISLGERFTSKFNLPEGRYQFDAEGRMVINHGVVGDYLYLNGVMQKAYQLIFFEGDYYFVNDYNKIYKNASISLTEKFTAQYGLPAGRYTFDAEGKMIINHGVVDDYLYINGVKQKAYQLIFFEGNYYFVNDYDKIIKNKSFPLTAKFTAQYGLPEGKYEFDAEGKMIINHGVVGDYLYINGVMQKAYQLIEFEGSYYFVSDYNKIIKNASFPLTAKFTEQYGLPEGKYEFDAEGRMIIKHGVVGDYLYINGVLQTAYRLVEFEGSYYFVNDYNKIIKNGSIPLTAKFTAQYGLPEGKYEFDAEGKMIIKHGVVGDYLYINNEMQKAYQLIEFEGSYYFVNDYNKIIKNGSIPLTAKFTAQYGLPEGKYEFDAEGRMIIKHGVVGDYLYINGEMQKAYQLIKFEGDYYFVNDYNKIIKNGSIPLTAKFTAQYGLPEGKYEFDADGKMIIKHGVVGDYLYINGEMQKAYQLIEFEGDYYFVNDYNKILKNKRIALGAKFTVDVVLPDGSMLEPGNFFFDADGKMIFN